MKGERDFSYVRDARLQQFAANGDVPSFPCCTGLKRVFNVEFDGDDPVLEFSISIREAEAEFDETYIHFLSKCYYIPLVEGRELFRPWDAPGFIFLNTDSESNKWITENLSMGVVHVITLDNVARESDLKRTPEKHRVRFTMEMDLTCVRGRVGYPGSKEAVTNAMISKHMFDEMKGIISDVSATHWTLTDIPYTSATVVKVDDIE